MRFLILTQYFAPEIGAPSIRFAALIRALRKHGHDVEVVTAMPNYPKGRIFPDYRGRFYMRENRDGVIIHRVWLYGALGTGLPRLMSYLSFTMLCLVGLFKARRPDYLFVESPPIFLGVPAVLYSRIRRVPFIFNVADLWPDSLISVGYDARSTFVRLAERLEAWIYCKAAFVNAVTEGIADVLRHQKGVPEKKILFLPNGVDTELFRPRSPNQKLAEELGLVGKKIILYAGNMGVAQGLDVVVDAMALVADRDPDILFVFIGDGSEKQRIANRVRELGLNNIRFLDPRPPEAIGPLYDLAVAGFASLKKDKLMEGARPSKIFPVMACAKPVIYSADGEGARLVEEAGAGLVAPAGDAKALSQAILRLTNEPELARELGRKGCAYVQSHLDWFVLAGHWLEQLARGNQPVAPAKGS